MKGTCLDWHVNSGRIKGEDGRVYPCHFNAIQSQDTSLDVDAVVEFDVGEELCTKRKIAVMVKRVPGG